MRTIMKKVKKLLARLGDFASLGWTLAGTGMVLITLSGSTQRTGIYISIIAVSINILYLVLMGDEE